MTNHVHLLIHVHDDELHRVMQYINYRYVRWFNYKYKKVGHLFQDRYRSIEVSNESYLLNLCRYIHKNPLVANMVKNLEDYPWSSHSYYVTEKTPEWLEINFMLAVVKNKTQKDYSQFIDQPMECEFWKPAMYISDDGKIIFDTDMIHQFNLENNIRATLQKRFLSEETVCNIVCKNLEVNYEFLQSTSKNKCTSQKRMILADFWMRYANLNIVTIAKRFHRTHGTLSRQLTQFHSSKDRYISSKILEKIHLEINELLL